MSGGSLPLCNKSCSFLGSSLFLGCNLSLTASMSGSSSGGCSSTCLGSSSSCSHILSVPSPEHQSSSGSSSPSCFLLSGGSSTSGSKDSLVSGMSPLSSSFVGSVTFGDHPSVGKCSLSSEGKHSSVLGSASEDSLAAGMCSASGPNDSYSLGMSHSATMSNESCPSNPHST